MAERFRVEQIDHVELFVPDRREAAKWYGDVLGLDVVPECEHWAKSPGGPLMISPDRGNTKLALFEGTPQGNRDTAGFRRVAFRVRSESFVRFASWLLDQSNHDANRPSVHSQVVDHDTSFSIYFSDPYGHPLEVTTYDYAETKSALGAA